MHLRTAVMQLNSRDNPAENLATVERFLDRAADMGAQLVGLPEFWTYLGPYAGFSEAAQTIPGPAIERLQEKARRHKMIVHGGSIIERHPDLNGKFYNTSVLINRNGEISARYRKIHLFDVDLANGEKHHESERIAPGNEIVTAEVDGVTFGLSVCYDLRFPELFRSLAVRGAQILMVPAGFTLHTGRDHWEVLLRAGHRKPLLRRRPRTCREISAQPGVFWSFNDRRSLGPGPGAGAGYANSHHGRY